VTFSWILVHGEKILSVSSVVIGDISSCSEIIRQEEATGIPSARPDIKGNPDVEYPSPYE